jgi:hypothetical protein
MTAALDARIGHARPATQDCTTRSGLILSRDTLHLNDRAELSP